MKPNRTQIYRQSFVFPVLLAALFAVTPSFAAQRFIVRSTGGLTSLNSLCALVGCSSVTALNDPQSQLFLLALPNNVSPSSVGSLLGGVVSQLTKLGITNIEPDLVVLLPGSGGIARTGAPPPGQLNSAPANLGGQTVWDGYANQPSATIVRSEQARSSFGVNGAGTVAIIDTGIDPSHPALAGVVVPGYDFTRNQQSTTTETADVSQSTAAVVDGGNPPAMSGPTFSALGAGQAMSSNNSAFGHGTMVAGIVHLVAPSALLMPLKAFGSNGQGNTSDIIRAVYYASAHGARVVNMSFSMTNPSTELQTAINYAAGRNMICVAAAGNDGGNAVVYPAGFGNVIGVGSTTLTDQRSSFSNYGRTVWVAAPGEQIVSTYPLGAYATGSGTSFSAPFVSGTAALLVNEWNGNNQSSASKAIANAKSEPGSGLGNGRLDVYQAVGSQVGRH
jgi:subtilisin family serine protease